LHLQPKTKRERDYNDRYENTDKIRPGPIHRNRKLVSPRHGARRSLYGRVQYVAETAGAYWLIDEIAFAQRGNKRVAAEEFQSWKLKVNPDHSARLTCEDGNGNVVFSKIIPYSDFPLEEITLYFTNKTILLPSEY
jgi:hypothetical protein